MSRTIRRTRGNVLEPYETVPFDVPESMDKDLASVYLALRRYRKTIARNDPRYAKEWWRLHADSDEGRKRFPEWLFRYFNKRVSRKEERLLRRAIKEGTLEDLVFDARKGCGWTQY